MPLAPFLHLSSFTLHHAYRAGGRFVHHAGSRECLALVLHAETPLVSIVAGRERRYDLRAGQVGIVPADRASHTVVATPECDTSAFLLLVPHDLFGAVAEEEGTDGDGDLPEAFAGDDARLCSLLIRLRWLDLSGNAAGPDAEATARELLIEAAARRGGARPDWERDGGVFDRGTMRTLTDHIDGHRAAMPRLADLARIAGLSPGHFARKFHRSTGTSVDRFIHHRRIRAALGVLAREEAPIETLAGRLGYASQSHFTRVFSALTGMTPARYRRGLADGRDASDTHRTRVPTDGMALERE